MKIGVTYSNGEVFQHFGHTEQFKIYEVEDGKIKSSYVVQTNGAGHGALVTFLIENGVDTLICGGIGGVKNALASQNIQVFGGVTGSCDEVVNAFLNNKLVFNPDVTCEHHSHDHNCNNNGNNNGNCHDHNGNNNGNCHDHNVNNNGNCHDHNGNCGNHGCTDK